MFYPVGAGKEKKAARAAVERMMHGIFRKPTKALLRSSGTTPTSSDVEAYRGSSKERSLHQQQRLKPLWRLRL
eukprot:2804415-Amphidinium_carterae.2